MTLSITFYDDIKYHRQDFINRDLDFIGNGVVNLTDFPITYPSPASMNLSLGQGIAWVDGYRIPNDSNLVTVTIPTADPTYPRIDIIQIGHDDINQTYSLVVKKGVASTSPIEPGADPNYVKLYAIAVAANVTSITSANVTDRRSLVPLKVSGTQISYQGVVSTTQLSQTAAPNSVAQRDANGNVVSNLPVANNQNPNLLFNPSARLGLGGWSNIAGSSWTANFGQNYGEGGLFQSPNVNNTGAYTILESQKIPITANQPITVSGEVNTTLLTAGQAWIEIDYFNASNGQIGAQPIQAINPGQNWTKTSGSVTTPASTAYITIRLVLSTTAVGQVYFKKIKVETGSIATTFSDDNSLNTMQYGSVLGLVQALSGGYKMQSAGSSAIVATAGTPVNVTINFPVAFTSNPLCMATPTSVSVGDAGYVNVRVGAVTASSMTVAVNSYVAQTVYFSWIAVGS